MEKVQIASLFSHYVTEVAYWYDLSDAAQCFERNVPELALDEPLLFYAIIAVAALHVTKTMKRNLKDVAEQYHDRCIACLIALKEGDALVSNGRALAATCLLRSYEILDGKAFIERTLNQKNDFSQAMILTRIAIYGGSTRWLHIGDSSTAPYHAISLQLDFGTTFGKTSPSVSLRSALSRWVSTQSLFLSRMATTRIT